jgi:hypothetical protein
VRPDSACGAISPHRTAKLAPPKNFVTNARGRTMIETTALYSGCCGVLRDHSGKSSLRLGSEGLGWGISRSRRNGRYIWTNLTKAGNFRI